MTFRKTIAALGAASLVCAGAEALAAEEMRAGGPLYYTKVVVGADCVFFRTEASEAERAAPLAGVLLSIVGPLISSGVDLIVARIQRIKEEYSASESALGRGLFYDWEAPSGRPLNYCITVVRAPFGGTQDNSGVTAWAEELRVASGAERDRVAILAGARNLGLAARPDLYAEFHIEYTDKPGAFEIKPMLIDFHKPLAKRSGANGKLVSFAFRFDAVSTDARGATFASAALPPVRLFQRSVYAPDALEGLTTGYSAAPAQEDISADGVSVRSPVPFNIIATICEAEEPSILAQLLANSAAAIGENVKPQLIGAATRAIEGGRKKDKDSSGN